MDLKGLHRCKELGEGGDVNTTQNLEVQKSYTQKSMVLIAYVRLVGSVVSWDVKMSTKLDVEPVVGATEAQEGSVEVVWPCIQVWGGTE